MRSRTGTGYLHLFFPGEFHDASDSLDDIVINRNGHAPLVRTRHRASTHRSNGKSLRSMPRTADLPSNRSAISPMAVCRLLGLVGQFFRDDLEAAAIIGVNVDLALLS